MFFPCISRNENLKLSLDREVVFSQKTFDGRYIYFVDREIEPFSKIELKVFGADDEQPEQSLTKDNLSMENEYLKISVKEDGSVQVYDKELGKFAFDECGNILKMHKNIPYYWDNWDIADGVEKTGFTLKASKIMKVESGPIREIIRVEYEAEGSKIIQDYILVKKSKRLDIKTKIDWHTRRALLRAYFPVNVLTRKAIFDISGGFIERSSHKNTKYEQARFEVPVHRWADLSQTDFGVAILNDGKYGYSVHQNTIALSLIKAGIFPDFFADEGFHEFTYSVYTHHNEIKTIVQESEDLNKPLTVIKGELKIPHTILKITPNNFKVTCFRKNTQGNIVLRLVEVFGTSGKLSLEVPWHKENISLSNILEEKSQQISFPISYHPFKIYTLIL